MQEWKIRQFVYHSTADSYIDDLNHIEYTYSEDNVVEEAVIHFTQRVEKFLYPAKSYFVAICYAHWIAEQYGGDFYDLLNDPDLLYDNDPYFKTYDQDKQTYDEILSRVQLLPMTGMVPDVREYYDAECGIEQSIPN